MQVYGAMGNCSLRILQDYSELFGTWECQKKTICFEKGHNFFKNCKLEALLTIRRFSTGFLSYQVGQGAVANSFVVEAGTAVGAENRPLDSPRRDHRKGETLFRRNLC